MHEQHHAGAEAIINMKSDTVAGAHPNFALDDVGCNGTESNLLDCLPEHNCGMNRGAENAGVLCLIEADTYSSINIIIFTRSLYRSQTRAWSEPRKQ